MLGRQIAGGMGKDSIISTLQSTNAIYNEVKPIQNRVYLKAFLIVSIFGTMDKTQYVVLELSKWIVKLNLLKLQGVQGIDIMFDGDDAGQKAAEQLHTIAEKLELSVQKVKLKDGVDPGSLTPDQIKKD